VENIIVTIKRIDIYEDRAMNNLFCLNGFMTHGE